MMTKLLPNERLDDLQIRGYEIIQSPGRFCFGMDAVLLSTFANVKKHEKALDLGTGTGILPILLEAKYPGLHYTGLEIQEESADMARRSVSHNGLEERIDIVTEISRRQHPYSEPPLLELLRPIPVHDWRPRTEESEYSIVYCQT